MKRFVILAVAVVFVSGFAVIGDASAQSAACVDLCRIPCVKPISFADRWDDVTGIPGYMGDAPGSRPPDWRENKKCDFEIFSDANGNGLWDSGESYADANGNGSYDRELYDPSTTGYTGVGDAGLEVILHPTVSLLGSVPGQYFSVGLPPSNKGTPLVDGISYRFAWTDCQGTAIEPGDRLVPTPAGMVGPTNQAMRDLIAEDFEAEWDATTASVINSDFPLSPRIWFIPLHDPRIPISSGSQALVVRKVAAFFAETMVGSAECRGRLLRVQAFGETCGGASAGGFVVMCPVPAPNTSWGKVKASYR